MAVHVQYTLYGYSAESHYPVGCRFAQAPDRYPCMTACLDQVHIVMQIAYGFMNARRSFSDCRRATSRDALAHNVLYCTRVHKTCNAGAVIIYAVCICSLLDPTVPHICLAGRYGWGRQGLVGACTVGTKQRWTVRSSQGSEQSTFPFPLVAEAVLCMSLSRGCTAEYRTVQEWSTKSMGADLAFHTV